MKLEELRKIPLGPYTLVHWEILSPKFRIPEVEKMYESKYIGEVALLSKNGNWAEQPVLLFYTEKTHPEGSNWFGLYFDMFGRCMITNGISAVQNKDGTPVVYTGLLNEKDNEVYYSAVRHDYQKHGDFMIDGGRDYTKSSLGGSYVNFVVQNEKFVLTENQ